MNKAGNEDEKQINNHERKKRSTQRGKHVGECVSKGCRKQANTRRKKNKGKIGRQEGGENKRWKGQREDLRKHISEQGAQKVKDTGKELNAQVSKQGSKE